MQGVDRVDVREVTWPSPAAPAALPAAPLPTEGVSLEFTAPLAPVVIGETASIGAAPWEDE